MAQLDRQRRGPARARPPAGEHGRGGRSRQGRGPGLACEDILGSYGGRPHWGKMHALDAAALRPAPPLLRLRGPARPP
ncbi:D-arabinono-1,4-lactone oxidase [Streptomyces sp. NPDC057579]|uniref:D-arabinono-1,4-lactone oxidase n=1 Tax=Streptomyces sp. NPDC057579 TaxID=3346172 RepID=UPI00368554D5